MPITIPQRHDLSRRDWIVRVLQVTGGSALATGLVAQATATHWRPAFLTASQNESLVSLGECIIPGSGAAGCNQVIDLILALESEQTRQQFVNALAAFDAEATRRGAASFRLLPSAQQKEVLTAASADRSALAVHFHVLKEWTADVYWSSQEGLRELGWKGRVAWADSDGCPHPESHTVQ